MKLRSQFARALFRGAAMQIRHGNARRRALASVLRALWTSGRIRVAPGVYRARLNACSRCQLRDAELWTCGDGVSLMTLPDGRLVPAGCQCWLPLKAAMPESDCFLAEVGLPSRWPQTVEKP